MIGIKARSMKLSG